LKAPIPGLIIEKESFPCLSFSLSLQGFLIDPGMPFAPPRESVLAE
jgi:hypothetical protein